MRELATAGCPHANMRASQGTATMANQARFKHFEREDRWREDMQGCKQHASCAAFQA